MPAPPPIPAYALGTFARFTVERRLPKILADATATLDARAQSDPRWNALESALRDGGPIDRALFSSPTPFWQHAIESSSGSRWDALSFFDLEFLFYRAIDSIANDLCPGWDVFAPARRAALAEALPRVARAIDVLGERLTLSAAIGASLAGNEADLSQLSRPYSQTAGTIVKDERAELEEALQKADGAIVVLADNAGAELCFDLVLVDLLLGAHARTVELQLKPHPMFVSDALIADAEETLHAFREASASSSLARVGARLHGAREQGRLILSAPAEWGEPRHMNMLDPALAASLRDAALVVAKGDLNSRRFFEDRAWPADAPVNVASVGTEMRAFALRVLKSDCVVGVPPPLAARLFATEPDWRSRGSHSVIQRVDRGAP